MSVLRQLFRGVRLQEACFRDVVILYRAAVPDAGVSECLLGLPRPMQG